jgi:hypothetical protein
MPKGNPIVLFVVCLMWLLWNQSTQSTARWLVSKQALKNIAESGCGLTDSSGLSLEGMRKKWKPSIRTASFSTHKHKC